MKSSVDDVIVAADIAVEPVDYLHEAVVACRLDGPRTATGAGQREPTGRVTVSRIASAGICGSPGEQPLHRRSEPHLVRRRDRTLDRSVRTQHVVAKVAVVIERERVDDHVQG